MDPIVALFVAALFGSWSGPAELPAWTEYVQATWASELPGGELRAIRVERAAPWMARWRGDETVTLAQAQWIEHVVVPRERASQIAARYGVKYEDLRQWNRLSSRAIERGQRLRVHATRLPPPRERILHRVREGETWGSIAAAYRVETADLRAYNSRAPLEAGREVVVWSDPGAPWTVGRRRGEGVTPAPVIAEGARSVGRPNRGRIESAIPLPVSDLYTNRDIEAFLWGTTHTLRHLTAAFADFRARTGYEGEVVIGAISRQRGGRFPPHRSHQSGRDVDIRLPILPGARPDHTPNADEVDWHATWGLIRALLDTNEVVSIYLDSKLQRRLYEAARSMGESHESLSTIIAWAREDAPLREVGTVTHSKGHTAHIHVRFACGADEPRCRTNSR